MDWKYLNRKKQEFPAKVKKEVSGYQFLWRLKILFVVPPLFMTSRTLKYSRYLPSSMLNLSAFFVVFWGASHFWRVHWEEKIQGKDQSI